jgi:surface antigen
MRKGGEQEGEGRLSRIRGLLALTGFLSTLAAFAEASPPSHVNCVQYVRANSAIRLSGDAWTWWRKAQGKYRTGSKPRAGSVLVFRQTNKMRHGHVAVVARVIDARTIAIDHANWAPRNGDKGRVALSVLVRDASARNNWSEVRVWHEPSDSFGYPYKTYGFIYERPRS